MVSTNELIISSGVKSLPSTLKDEFLKRNHDEKEYMILSFNTESAMILKNADKSTLLLTILIKYLM